MTLSFNPERNRRQNASLSLVGMVLSLFMAGCHRTAAVTAAATADSPAVLETTAPASPSYPSDLQGLLDRLGTLWEIVSSERDFTAEDIDAVGAEFQRLESGLAGLPSGPLRDQAIRLLELAQQEFSEDQKLKELIDPILALAQTDPKLFEQKVEGIRPQVAASAKRQKQRKANFDRLYGSMIVSGEVSPFVPHGGIVGIEAPLWKVRQWRFLSKDGPPQVTDFRGKVLVLYGFQAWCPSCHETGFPTLKRLVDRFKDNDKVAFVAIQTVFEGFEANSLQRGAKMMEEFGLDFPMGHDPGQSESGSTVMDDYRQAGTPWIVIIDQEGIVRFNDFRIEPDKAETMIRKMLAKAP